MHSRSPPIEPLPEEAAAGEERISISAPTAPIATPAIFMPVIGSRK